MQRVSGIAAEGYCKSALSSNIMSDLQDETGAQYSRLQMLLDQISNYEPIHGPPDNFIGKSETALQATKSFNTKFQHFDSEIPPALMLKVCKNNPM